MFLMISSNLFSSQSTIHNEWDTKLPILMPLIKDALFEKEGALENLKSFVNLNKTFAQSRQIVIVPHVTFGRMPLHLILGMLDPVFFTNRNEVAQLLNFDIPSSDSDEEAEEDTQVNSPHDKTRTVATYLLKCLKGQTRWTNDDEDKILGDAFALELATFVYNKFPINVDDYFWDCEHAHGLHSLGNILDEDKSLSHRTEISQLVQSNRFDFNRYVALIAECMLDRTPVSQLETFMRIHQNNIPSSRAILLGSSSLDTFVATLPPTLFTKRDAVLQLIAPGYAHGTVSTHIESQRETAIACQNSVAQSIVVYIKTRGRFPNYGAIEYLYTRHPIDLRKHRFDTESTLAEELEMRQNQPYCAKIMRLVEAVIKSTNTKSTKATKAS